MSSTRSDATQVERARLDIPGINSLKTSLNLSWSQQKGKSGYEWVFLYWLGVVLVAGKIFLNSLTSSPPEPLKQYAKLLFSVPCSRPISKSLLAETSRLSNLQHGKQQW
nr:hypothetical protein L203_02150 [Cryptococcus depauperatus CBS 7841]